MPDRPAKQLRFFNVDDSNLGLAWEYPDSSTISKQQHSELRLAPPSIRQRACSDKKHCAVECPEEMENGTWQLLRVT